MITSRLLRTISLICFTVLVSAAPAADPSLKEIMQGLRDDLLVVTDGLLIDDFARVAQGADGIAHHAPISAPQAQQIAAELGPEMAAFEQFDELVHRLSLSIAAAAKEGDRDRAIAGYRQMMDGCLACHAAYKERIAAVLAASP